MNNQITMIILKE